jgi:hypothetical protein
MSNKASKGKLGQQLDKASLMRQPAPMRFARKMRQLIASNFRRKKPGVKKDLQAESVLEEVKAISKALQGTKLPSVVLPTGGRSRRTPKLTKAGQTPWVWNDPMMKLYYPQALSANGTPLPDQLVSALPDSLKDTDFAGSGSLMISELTMTKAAVTMPPGEVLPTCQQPTRRNPATQQDSPETCSATTASAPCLPGPLSARSSKPLMTTL